MKKFLSILLLLICLSSLAHDYVWKEDYLSSNYISSNYIHNFQLPSNITWMYENWEGNVSVKVIFEVVAFGISNTTKQALEDEIQEAIQNIIDLHFPPSKDDK